MSDELEDTLSNEPLFEDSIPEVLPADEPVSVVVENALPPSLPLAQIIELAWNDVRGNDPEYLAVVPQFRDKLYNAAYTTVNTGPSSVAGSVLRDFEQRILALVPNIDESDLAKIRTVPNYRFAANK